MAGQPIEKPPSVTGLFVPTMHGLRGWAIFVIVVFHAAIATRNAPHGGTNGLLRDFALTAIRDHPRVYAEKVAGGTLALFAFGVGSKPPAEPPDERWRTTAVDFLEQKYFPGHREPEPNDVLFALQQVLHTPRDLPALGDGRRRPRRQRRHLELRQPLPAHRRSPDRGGWGARRPRPGPATAAAVVVT